MSCSIFCIFIATRQLILDANDLLFTPLHLFDNLRNKLQSDEQINRLQK